MPVSARAAATAPLPELGDTRSGEQRAGQASAGCPRATQKPLCAASATKVAASADTTAKDSAARWWRRKERGDALESPYLV